MDEKKQKVGVIYKKIGEILRDVEPISKARKNTQQGYSFRGIEDAMNMLSPLLAKHGVFPTIAKVEDIRNDEVQSKSGTGGYHYVRRYTVRFWAEDGSYVDTQADGEAIDYGDKASNKAYSTAYREAMWKMFIVPFEADDIENHDHELTPPPKKEKKQALDASNPVFADDKKRLKAASNLKELQNVWSDLSIQAKEALLPIKEEMKAIILDAAKEG